MKLIDWCNTYSNIIQICISLLSLFATIAVSFFIYWLQVRHEKELEKNKEQQMRERIIEKAHAFLIDNETEREFLPWCIIASNLHRHEKHTREIYTNFCRCSDELQKEILKQGNFTVDIISDIEWFDKCFEKLKEDIKTYNLGVDRLYDIAKYFRRGFEHYRDEKWVNLYDKEDFNVLLISNKVANPMRKQSLIDYIDEYDFVLFRSESAKEKINNPVPPLDYMWNSYNLDNAEEKEVCRWMLECVFDITVLMHNRKNRNEVLRTNLTDAEPETFEDKYLEALYWIYYTYFFESVHKAENNKKIKRSKIIL